MPDGARAGRGRSRPPSILAGVVNAACWPPSPCAAGEGARRRPAGRARRLRAAPRRNRAPGPPRARSRTRAPRRREGRPPSTSSTGSFVFTDRVGGWETVLEIAPDGSFTGRYTAVTRQPAPAVRPARAAGRLHLHRPRRVHGPLQGRAPGRAGIPGSILKKWSSPAGAARPAREDAAHPRGAGRPRRGIRPALRARRSSNRALSRPRTRRRGRARPRRRPTEEAFARI